MIPELYAVRSKKLSSSGRFMGFARKTKEILSEAKQFFGQLLWFFSPFFWALSLFCLAILADSGALCDLSECNVAKREMSVQVACKSCLLRIYLLSAVRPPLSRTLKKLWQCPCWLRYNFSLFFFQLLGFCLAANLASCSAACCLFVYGQPGATFDVLLDLSAGVWLLMSEVLCILDRHSLEIYG